MWFKLRLRIWWILWDVINIHPCKDSRENWENREEKASFLPAFNPDPVIHKDPGDLIAGSLKGRNGTPHDEE